MILVFRPYIRQLTVFLAVMVIFSMTTGCQLPAYSLYTPQEPSYYFGQFIDAINRGDEKAANEWLIGSSWSNRVETPLSSSEEELLDALTKSRSFVILDQEYLDSHSRVVRMTIRLTTLDMNLFEDALIDAVETDIKQKQYEGQEIQGAEEIRKCIEHYMHELLQNPEEYHSTSVQSFEMRLNLKKWRIVMTDTLYRALLGMR